MKTKCFLKRIVGTVMVSFVLISTQNGRSASLVLSLPTVKVPDLFGKLRGTDDTLCIHVCFKDAPQNTHE